MPVYQVAVFHDKFKKERTPGVKHQSAAERLRLLGQRRVLDAKLQTELKAVPSRYRNQEVAHDEDGDEVDTITTGPGY